MKNFENVRISSTSGIISPHLSSYIRNLLYDYSSCQVIDLIQGKGPQKQKWSCYPKFTAALTSALKAESKNRPVREKVGLLTRRYKNSVQAKEPGVKV